MASVAFLWMFIKALLQMFTFLWHLLFTGVDFLLSSKDQVLQLVALEMNSQLCLETCSALESMGRMVGAPGGETACALVETMLRRAQCHLMEGKHLLVIGAGGFSKKFVWEAARDYGLKVRCGNTDLCSPSKLQDGLARAAPPHNPYLYPINVMGIT